MHMVKRHRYRALERTLHAQLDLFYLVQSLTMNRMEEMILDYFLTQLCSQCQLRQRLFSRQIQTGLQNPHIFFLLLKKICLSEVIDLINHEPHRRYPRKLYFCWMDQQRCPVNPLLQFCCKLRLQDLSILDPNIRFYSKFYPPSQFLRSGIVRVGQNMRQLIFYVVLFNPLMG